MSYELRMSLNSQADGFFDDRKYSYHEGDKGVGCVHDKRFGRLTIGNVLRTERGAKCVNGASEELKEARPSNYVPYEPKPPESHPVNPTRLEEWKHNALRSNDPEEEAGIEQFVSTVRHVDHEEFLRALEICFEKFYEIFPKEKYAHALMNDVDNPPPDQEKSLNSGKWVAELVNHHGFYDLNAEGSASYYWEDGGGTSKFHAIEHRGENKEIVRFMVDDAIFSGENFNNLDYKPPVYIVPYIKSLKKLMHANRNPLMDAFFVNATTGKVTRRTTLQPDGQDLNPKRFLKLWRDKKKLKSRFGSIWIPRIVIYAEEMTNADSEPIPFYFDHKLADFSSWGHDYWKLRGYHKSSRYPDPKIQRTPFIGGCEREMDIETDKEFLKKGKAYTCPYPPYYGNLT